MSKLLTVWLVAFLFSIVVGLSGCGSSEKKEGSGATSSGTGSPGSSSSGSTSTPATISLSFVTDRVNLGSVARYTNTASQTITLQNTGTVTMTCDAMYSYGGSSSYSFTIVEDNCVDRKLGGGQSCTYKVRGSPSSLGESTVQYRASCYGEGSYSATYAFATFTMTGL